MKERILNLKDFKSNKKSNTLVDISSIKREILESLLYKDIFNVEEKGIIFSVLENNLTEEFYSICLNETLNEGLVKDVTSKLKDFGKNTLDKTSKFFSKLGTLVKKIMKIVKKFFVTIFNWITKFFKTVISKAKDSFQEISQEILKKIKDKDSVKNEKDRLVQVSNVIKQKLFSFDEQTGMAQELENEIKAKTNSNPEEIESAIKIVSESLYTNFELNSWKFIKEGLEVNQFNIENWVSETDSELDSILLEYSNFDIESEMFKLFEGVDLTKENVEKSKQEILKKVTGISDVSNYKFDKTTLNSFKSQMSTFLEHTFKFSEKSKFEKILNVVKVIRIANLPFAAMSFVYTTLGVSMNRFLTKLETYLNKLDWLKDIKVYVVIGIFVATILELILKIVPGFFVSHLDLSGFSIAKSLTIKPILYMLGVSPEVIESLLVIISIVAVILTLEEIVELWYTNDSELTSHSSH